MAKFSVKKALAIAGALTVLGAGVFFGIDAASDDFNVVFYPDPIVNPIPTPDPDPTPIPDPDPQPGLIQLAAPEMAYNQEDNILTWEEVENASGYLLNVNGVEETTTQTQAVLDIGQNEQYKISLKALGDGEKYSDSEIATLSGVRQNLDQMYYEQIKSDLKEIIESKTIAFARFNIQDLLNIDFQDNNLLVTAKCNSTQETITRYTTFVFKLNNQHEVNTLSDISDIVNEIKSDSTIRTTFQNTFYEQFGNEIDCYNKLIEDTRLTGQLKDYLDNGYEPTLLYSCLDAGNQVDNFTVNSYIKLSKGDDIKVVTVKNIVSQKFNNSFAFDGYVNAYIDGTAEDVVIEETSFTEASPVSSLWQAADEKYDGQNMNLSSNQVKSGVKYQSMSYSQNGQNYILTYPVDDFSLEL